MPTFFFFFGFQNFTRVRIGEWEEAKGRGQVSLPLRRDGVKFVKEQHTCFGSSGPLEDIPDRLFARADIFVQ